MHLQRAFIWSFVVFSMWIGSAWAATQTVTVEGGSNMRFSPSTLTINAGDSVTFVYGGGTLPHNVVADDGSFRCATSCSGAGGNATGAAWSATVPFANPGTFGYYCDVHGAPGGIGMAGSIVVTGKAPPPAITIGGYLSGNWFITGQGGAGFQFEVIKPASATDAPQMLAIWFVYTPTASTTSDGSGQNWIYSQGVYDPTSNTVTLPAILQTGARFPPNFNSSDIRRVSPDSSSLWGTLTFTFTDCNNGTASWHSDVAGYNNQNDTPLPIQRLTQIDGTTCPQ
jgi:plastocyanin